MKLARRISHAYETLRRVHLTSAFLIHHSQSLVTPPIPTQTRSFSATPSSSTTSSSPSSSAKPLTSVDLSQSLLAVSPVDGRYKSITAPLAPYFSEFALIKYRVIVEIRWLQYMAGRLPDLPALSSSANDRLESIITNFSLDDAARVKDIEKVTRHDVKAVEYFLKEKVNDQEELKKKAEFLHFACTSEDISNLAYALMLKEAREKVLVPKMRQLIDTVVDLSVHHAAAPMLARTHGQPASPTTMGKEMAVFAARLSSHLRSFQRVKIQGKFAGAVGNLNAHMSAYPSLDWSKMARGFVKDSLGIEYSEYSTQIECHDFIAELFNSVSLFNTTLLDMDRDMWGYISFGYWKLATVKGEIGSSTMPHKVNPIDFENSEGNLGIANAIFSHLSAKLPISRFQRDLSDSTVLRNIGVGLGYSLIAYHSSLLGLSKIAINQDAMDKDLDTNWEVLGEPIQTVLRRYGVDGAYERLKDLTRGKRVDREGFHKFIDGLVELPVEERERLKQMTPRNYIGHAQTLAENVKTHVTNTLQET